MNVKVSLERWVEECGGRLCLVFADVVASTPLLYKVETGRYSDLRRKMIAVARSASTDCGGRRINSAGDSLFFAFTLPENGFRFACLLREQCLELIDLRIGAHFGSATATDDDLVGRDVHFAARVMSHGDKGEIWVSEALKDALESVPADEDVALHDGGECDLRGVPGTHRLWRVE